MSKKLTPLNNLKRKPTSLRQLFSSPKRWHKGDYGIGKSGKPICFSDEIVKSNPICLCLLGGLGYIYGNTGYNNHKIQEYIRKNYNHEYAEDFNDSKETTFEDIKKLVNDLNL